MKQFSNGTCKQCLSRSGATYHDDIRLFNFHIITGVFLHEHRHQLIYSAITDLAVNQKPVDILTVKEQLAKRGDLEEVGGPFYITQLSSKVASSAHIEYHARIIAQKALARELITFTSNVQSKAFDETLDVDDLMQEAEGRLFEISQQNMKKDYTQINPVIAEAYQLIQIAAARTDGLSGLESGFTKLDKMTSGWQRSDLIIIAARPAMGKTAFVLSMAKNIAVNYRNPVAVFSLEMSNVQLVNRLISNACEIPSEKIKSGQLADYEWQQLDYKLRDLLDAPLYVDDTPSLSVFELRTKARRLVREHGVRIIIIDYLQLMNASGMSFGSRQEEVSTISLIGFKLQVFDINLILLNLIDLLFFALPLSLLFRFFVLQVGNFLIELFQLSFIIFTLDRFTLDFQLLDTAGNLVERFRHRVDLQTQTGCCLIHQVDRLIGQEPVSDVSCRQLDGCNDGIIFDTDLMVVFIFFLQTTQDGNSIQFVRFVHHNSNT